MRYAATLSDGLTAGSSSGTVGFAVTGLEVTSGSGESSLWPYATLAAATPLSRASRDVLLTSSVQDGATLFVGDPAFVTQLIGRAPGLSAGRERWKAARWWAAAGAAVAGAIGVLWWLDIGPARGLANAMPDGVRDRLGQQVIASMTRSYRVCNAPAGVAALDTLGQRLSAAAGSTAKFKIIVVNWKLLNAFAAPGEQIVLTRELVENARGPDEVAGVLAHEMGHGLERHPETALVRVVGVSAALEFMMGGSVSTIANIGLLLAQLNYTRAAELEADGHSLRILKNAGISNGGIGDFFKRVAKIEGSSTVGKTIGGYDILRTHPQSAERAKRALDQPPYPATPALTDADWQALRTICGAAPAQKAEP